MSIEELKEYGLIETSGDEQLLFPFKKVISVPPEDPGDNEGEISICVTLVRNCTELCLRLPSGDLIYLSCESISDLRVFENSIQSYEPNY